MIRHTGIVVNDIEKSIDFYSENFNLVVKKDMVEQGEYINNMLGLSDVNVRTVKLSDSRGNQIELLRFSGLPQIAGSTLWWGITDFGCSHVAFTVEDASFMHTKLQEQGCRNISEPQTPPGGKVKVFFCYVPIEIGGTYLEIVEEFK